MWLPSQSLFKFLLQQGDDSEKVTDNPIGGYLKNGRLSVFVDGDNNIGCLHPSLMLNGTRDSTGDVDLGPNGSAGLPDLMFVGNPARVDGCTRRAHGCS